MAHILAPIKSAFQNPYESVGADKCRAESEELLPNAVCFPPTSYRLPKVLK
jgi:hypothetical protein